MALQQPNQNDMLGKVTARLEELATCPEAEFNPEYAVNAIEEAIGGSLASKTHRAAINDFTTAEINHLEKVVKRFDQNPPAVRDNEDLELYTDMVAEAELVIATRREQIEKEMKLGGRTARINVELADARNKQQKIFIDAAHNPLNAAGDLDRMRRMKRV